MKEEKKGRKRINRENITDHLIEYQLNMIGKTIEDATTTPKWFQEFSMTSEQHEEFKKYAVPLLKKVFKFNTNRAKSTFEWFNLQFGLTIKENDTQ
jgi:hypothetical protein